VEDGVSDGESDGEPDVEAVSVEDCVSLAVSDAVCDGVSLWLGVYVMERVCDELGVPVELSVPEPDVERVDDELLVARWLPV